MPVYTIRLFSVDKRLLTLCGEILSDEPGICTFAAATEFSADAAGADVVICDEALADARTVRLACGEKATLIFCAAREAEGAALAHADEIWNKPLVYGYVEKRLRALLQALREKRQAHLQRLYLNTVIDTSPDLIWFKDTRGAHLKVNDAFCRAVGKTKAQIEGRGHYYIWDIPPEEYAEGEYICLESEEIVLARRERCLFDEKVKCKQGMRQFKTYKAPLIDDDGALLGTLGVAQDMTTQVQTASQLAQSMANFAATTNVAHLHYWKLDLATGRAHLGPACAAAFGVDQELEDFPECLIRRGLVHEDSIAACRKAQTLLREGHKDVAYDICLNLPSGQERWRRVKYAPYADENARASVVFGISEDIDAYKQIEKCFSISTRQNNITSWIYDLESRTIHSIMNPRQGFLEEGLNVSTPLTIFTKNESLCKADIPALLALHQRIEEGEASASAVVRRLRPDAREWCWLKISYTTVSGMGARAIGSARDITEEVRAQQLYATQIAYRSSSTRDAVATLQTNLTTNRVAETRGVPLRPNAVDALFRKLVARVPSEHREKAGEFYNRKNLLQAFSKGITSLSVEHLYARARERERERERERASGSGSAPRQPSSGIRKATKWRLSSTLPTFRKKRQPNSVINPS